jgi:hypothetical protein
MFQNNRSFLFRLAINEFVLKITDVFLAPFCFRLFWTDRVVSKGHRVLWSAAAVLREGGRAVVSRTKLFHIHSRINSVLNTTQRC